MITVRRATSDDVPWLLEQLQAFDQFYGSSRSLFPALDAADAIVSQLVATQPFFLAENADEPIGFIAGALHPHPYNNDLRVLSEMFWWVADEFRGSRAGLALLNAFVAFGCTKVNDDGDPDEHGDAPADWIIMTLEHESPVNPQTLTRRGFRPKETSYLLEVDAA